MRRTALLAALLLWAPLGAAEKLSSGEKGLSVPPFDVLDVTGPNATKKLCYR